LTTTVDAVVAEDRGKPAAKRAAGTDPVDGAAPVDRTLLQRAAHLVWRLIVTTVGSCLKYRVTGLAAEGAFFAVVSVPPLIFALIGGVGYVTDSFSSAQVEDVREAILDLFSTFLTDRAVNQVIEPTLDQVLRGGRFDVISIGFVLSLWSGSRALNVFVDTITIMHGLGGHRGIVKTRALSFVLYILALITGAVSLPLVVAGPTLVRDWLPNRADFLMTFYWPIVVVICICFLATLYHVSVPVRTNWSFNLPGATFSLVAWILGSYLLRWVLTITATDSRSIYGPLAAPIAVLLWLYIVALAVLIGAAVNAAFDTVFPQEVTIRARRELVARLRNRVAQARDRSGEPTVD
jgi:membrane protein